ncbi:MAG TPA: Ig-like domain-containing protein, partial [Gemmatimonadaceae bacterium]|nr:Ig-like domain-containing protein [Gemmatimonadaceae bacterium]
AGAFQLVVSSGALAPDTTEILAIAPAAATQLVMIAHPTSTVGAGATFSAGVEVQDAFGNRVSDWATPVQAGFDLAPSGATFVSGGSADVIDGVADFTDLQLDRAGTYRLRFTSGALTAALSDDFTVLAAGPEAMNAVAGDLQSAAAGTTLPTPLAVVVSDNFGNPISGVSVTWTVTAGGGSMSAPSSVTDSLGQASVTWTLGSVAGPQLATASAGFLPEVEFSATATIGEPSALLSAGGDAQSATVMEYVESPLRARVTDAFGNGVSGVIVNFNVISGLATVDAPSVATDSAGYAATSVRMDSVAGPVLVGAFAAGLTPDSLLYELTALPAAPNALLIVAGDGQSIATGDTTDTLRVRLIDGYGNPIAGETVTWDSPSGLTFTSTSGVTDSLGDVSTTVIAGGALGLLDVYARLALPELSAYFTVSVEVGPAVSLAIVSAPSGSNAGQTLSPLIVELRDAFGHVARLSEATVEVAVDGTLTPGALGGTLSVLADSGVAVFADLALTQAGPYALVVSASGVSPDTTEAFTVEPGEAMSIEYASADSVSAVVGGALETPLAVLLRDAYGNPVPNSPTNWYVSLSNAAQLDSSDLHTDSLGVARATLQVPTLAETFFVTADAFDAGSLIFTVRSTNAPGSTLTIESGPAGGEYRAGDSLQLLVARVQDAYGNVALDYAGDVTVEVDSGPAGATLLGMTTRAATAGVATFDDLALDLAGEYRLRVYAVGTDTSVTSALYVYGREAERIQIVDGDAQTDTVGQTLAQPLRVRVTDRFGNPVSEARVDWDGGEQVFIGELPASTDFNGEIAAPITLGSNAGTHPVTASLFELPDSTVTFTVTAVPDAADALFVVTAPDTAVAGDSVTIVIEARDSYGNRATGFAQNVTIEATDAAGEALGVTTVAADSGIATFSAIYFEAYGNYFMQAMADGLSYAYINLDVLPGTASQLTVESGDNQTAFAGSLLDSTIVLRLTDDFGNPIEAAEILVTRDIGTGDLGDFTDSLRVETDWDGRASFPWTLGPELGEQTLRALTESAGPIVIAATALQPVANVVWTGNTSTNPTDPSNWSTFTVPTQTDSVLIPAARNFYPTLTGFTTWGRLTVADGASINLASYWLNVRGSVRTPETGITGVTNSALVALDSGTVSGGFPTLRIEGTHSTAGFVRVQNSLTIPGSLTVAADDSLHVVGGVETFSGLPGSGLHQVGPSGIYIGGNLSGDAESTFGAGGRLHLLGDLTSGQLGSRAFVADSAHELYLLPGRTQALSLWEYDDNISGPCLRSCFGRIIAQKAPGQGGISIGNLFGSPVTLRARGGFLVDVDAINANTSALIIGAPSMLRSQDWAAFGRVTFDGALDAPRITADTLVALGTGLLPPQIEAPIVVVGNRQVDSELYGPVLVDGSLDVVGPNAIAGDLRTRGNGYLRMTEPNDTLLVYGELRLEGTAAAGQLTAGFLDVFGNLYIGSGPAVLAEANHTTRVRDFSPSITVIDPPSSQLGSLLVDSSNVLTLIADGLTLQGDLRLDGAGAQLVEARPSVVTVGNRLLDPNGNLNVSTVIVDGADGVQTPSVSGNLIVRGRSLLSDDLDVAASLTISDRGELTLGGHRVNVTGDFRTTASGSLRMQVSADTLRVLGDAVFGGGSTEGQLTAGVLELHRNLQQLRGDETFATFYSSVEHIVHFAGGTTNQISFESSNDTDGSRIGNLRIEKQDGQVTLPSGSLFVENIIGSFSNAGFSVGSSTLAANLYILGSVSPTVSSLERGFTIDALGNVQVLRGEGPGCTVNSIRVDGNRANFSPEACQLQP